MKLATVTLVLALVSAADVQPGNWKRALERAFEEEHYQATKVATFEINNVTEPGTVFVVRTDGIVADRSHAFGTFETRFKNGQALAPRSGFFSRGSTRVLKKGDRVYLRDVEVQDDAVILHLLTFDMHDVVERGSTEHTRLKSALRFDFDKAALPTMDVAALKGIVEGVLETEAAATAPKTIALGQTPAEVEAILGKPETIINLGERTIYVFKTLKITFVGGKVTDVQ